jgi:hypothetical protein
VGYNIVIIKKKEVYIMKTFNLTEAKDVAKELSIDFTKVAFSAEEFLAGLQVELEHGLVNSHTNVSNDNILITAKIVLAHLNENAKYYDENIGIEAWEHALDKFKGDTNDKKIVIM